MDEGVFRQFGPLLPVIIMIEIIEAITKEDKRISKEKVFEEFGKLVSDEQYSQIMADTTDENLFKQLHDERAKGDQWSEDRTMRKIASIPDAVVVKAERLWGPEVFKDPKLFKKAFVNDPIGGLFLTVPKHTI